MFENEVEPGFSSVDGQAPNHVGVFFGQVFVEQFDRDFLDAMLGQHGGQGLWKNTAEQVGHALFVGEGPAKKGVMDPAHGWV